LIGLIKSKHALVHAQEKDYRRRKEISPYMDDIRLALYLAHLMILDGGRLLKN
jgi:hypothetical protein